MRHQYTNPPRHPVIYTGRVDELNDELCVVDAYSDFGERGWMICVEERPKGREPHMSCRVWFPFDAKEEAVLDAKFGKYRHFADVEVPKS